VLAKSSRFCHVCGAALLEESAPVIVASAEHTPSSPGYSSSTSRSPYSSFPVYTPPISMPAIPAPISQATRNKLNGATFSVIIWTILWDFAIYIAPFYRRHRAGADHRDPARRTADGAATLAAPIALVWAR
jgi:hypothetical protein